MNVGPKNSPLPEQEFTRLLQPYVDRQFFSHMFAWCGSLVNTNDHLRNKKPHLINRHFSLEILPQNKDVFDVASLTKPLVTAALINYEVYKQRLSFDTEIGEWLPKEDHHSWNCQLLKLKIIDLLEHRSGLPAWRNFWITILPRQINSRQAYLSHIQLVMNRATIDLDRSQKKYVYSDLGYILLAAMLERLKNKSVSDLFDQFLKKTLPELKDLQIGFYPQFQDGISALVPVTLMEDKSRPKNNLPNPVHDENARALGGIAGHAGLYARGPDLIDYFSQLVCTTFGQWWLKKLMERKEAQQENCLGWAQGKDTSVAAYYGDHSLGHFGFTGCSLFFNFEENRFAVLLTNRVISGRQSPLISQLRADTHLFFRRMSELH